MKGRARVTKRRVPGTMTKTEERYAAFLEEARLEGRIVRWMFEPITLRLTEKRDGLRIPGVRYTPDFFVVTHEGHLDFHEVKPTWSARPQASKDSRLKLKFTAEQFPEYGLYCVSPVAKKDGGGWLVEQFSDNPQQEQDDGSQEGS